MTFTHTEDPGNLANTLISNLRQTVLANHSQGRRTETSMLAVDVIAAATGGDAKISKQLKRVKGTAGFGHDAYFHCFVTPDKAQADRLTNDHPHMLHTDREIVGDENVTAVKNNKTLRDFRSTSQAGVLKCRAMPCRCEDCR